MALVSPCLGSMMNKNRPIHLDITKIRMPVTAIASILHRISGVVLFLAIPYLLCVWSCSLQNADYYQSLQTAMHHGLTPWIVSAILLALLYHWVAGIRHLLMDMGIGEEKVSGRRGALLVFVSVAILALLLGVWLW
jgi:succinate dehydrogenase / fumarate reductase cytochrome b subunit